MTETNSPYIGAITVMGATIGLLASGTAPAVLIGALVGFIVENDRAVRIE